MASGPEGTEPQNYQTSVLKVSIHCEGCKKKVRKVLQGLEGVFTIDIDSKQNKVTVTGSVDAKSLIRRLVKYGKHAELWPEKKPTTVNSHGAAASDAKAKDAAPAADAAHKTEQQWMPNTEKQQQTEEGKSKATPPPPTEATETAPAAAAAAISGEVSASNPSIDAPKSNDGDKPSKSDKKDIEKPSAAVESNDSEEADEGKKGKKVQRETSSKDERAVSVLDKAGNTATVSAAAYAQPVYTVSHSAVQPSTSHAYYTASSAAMPSSYTYSGYPPLSAYPPENYSLDSYYGSMEAPAASEGSYDIFNDENPNACNLM